MTSAARRSNGRTDSSNRPFSEATIGRPQELKSFGTRKASAVTTSQQLAILGKCGGITRPSSLVVGKSSRMVGDVVSNSFLTSYPFIGWLFVGLFGYPFHANADEGVGSSARQSADLVLQTENVDQSLPIAPRGAKFWGRLQDTFSNTPLEDESSILASLGLKIIEKPFQRLEEFKGLKRVDEIQPTSYVVSAKYEVYGEQAQRHIHLLIKIRTTELCISEMEVIRRYGGGPWGVGVDGGGSFSDRPMPGLPHRRTYPGRGNATIGMEFGESGCLALISEYEG